MSDVRVPTDLQPGDCVVSSSNTKHGIGIVIKVFKMEDPHLGADKIAEVLWADGIYDHISCACLFPAFDSNFR